VTRSKLNGYERETIITFNEAEEMAHIFTYRKVWQSHLEKKLGLIPLLDNGYGGKEYMISKKRIRPPIARKLISPEEIAKRARQLKDARRNKVLKSKKQIPTSNFSEEKDG